MAQIVTDIERQVREIAESWIRRQICYVLNFATNVKNFNEQLQNLNHMRERIKRQVDHATRIKMEVIHRDVEVWLLWVTRFNEDAQVFSEEIERAKDGCFFGLCLNVKARYHLSMKAEEKSNEAAKHLLLARQFPSVSYRPAPQGLRFATIKDYETFESRACSLEEIMKGLKDPNVSMIGVWGMGGVGKTTLVRKAAEQANADRIFDLVIFSEVSLNQDLRRIQGEIAEALDFKFQKETTSGRSNELRERLRKETKILVILDNIWASLDLEELGIPFGDDHKGCKILMTSRDGQVLTNSLNIRVDALDDREAWDLFEKMAGGVVKAHNLQPLAVEIVRRCAGLPILISAVAMALRNKHDSRTWEAALYQLEHDEFDATVHSALELSYNHLESNVIKQLFLLCGQLVNTDYAIEDLFNYCMSLDSFEGVDRLEDRRNKLHKLVGDLKSSCLLLDGEKNGYVKMHDVVRMFAVSYARQKHNMFTEKYDDELEEWPRRNTIAKFSSIYFPHNYIHRLLEGLECPELNLFILFSKNRHLEIPSSFFQGVGGITVLEIKNIVLPSLPSSFRCLENLRTLSLEGCELEDMAMIGELVGLEVLRILNTDISHFPEEIRQLTGLKLLCLNTCINQEMIPRNVISSLTQLEELSMEGSIVIWEAEGDNCQNACLAELKKLCKLTSLNIQILNSNIMPNDMFSVKLERFEILIGDVWYWSWSREYETSRRLKLKLSTNIHMRPDVKELLKKTEDLYLDELGGVNSVCKLDRDGFPSLRCLHVHRGRNFQYIVDSNKRVPCHIFPCLELLSLAELINLKMICRGQLGVESFSKLRTLKVKRCGKLKNLFSFTIAKSLLQLQEIKVDNCENMEEVFSCESEEDGECDIVIELKQVHSVRLTILPKITSFCSEAKIVKQKLQTGDSSGSSQNMQLIPLLNGKIVFPNLEKLVLSSIGTEKIWDNSLLAMPRCFQTLRDLHVWGCNNLKCLFPIGVVTSLIQLQLLWVSECNSMEGIIEGAASRMIFPKLFCLDLDGLPKLKSFIFDEKEVNNDDLPPPLFDEKVELPTIERLTIKNMVNLKRIWHNELAPDSFCKLDYLWVCGCKNLLNVFSSNMLTRLQNLQNLRIIDCKSMDVIFDLEGVVDVDVRFELQKVTRLRLLDLPRLEELYIQNCEIVENIVAMIEVVDVDAKFEFPKVTSLRFIDLPRLRSFYPGIHTSEWPLLKTLEVTRCEKLKIFASECSNVQEGASGEYLFSHEKEIFPNLEELSVTWNYTMKEMWHGEFESAMFCRLKSLRVYEFHDEIITSFPPGFFNKLPNLEQLVVKRSAFEEIFPNGGVIGEAGELSRFYSLKTLTVEECQRLKILFPSSLLSCCNLIRLDVSNCNGLTYLMSSSIAKSMMQLQYLRVYGCFMMTSIVECVGEGEAEDDIIFPQLKTICIDSMPKISSFCGSQKLAFKLPSLEEVFIRRCPNLKTFCEGPLSTFKLRVIFSGKMVRCNGDLNTTIQTFYIERIVFPNMEKLVLSSIGTEKIWDNNLLARSHCFQTLRDLQVSSCNKLKFLFPIGVVKSLIQLIVLRVSGCNSMEGIIEGVAGATIFPKLRDLTLRDLPKLKGFCTGNSIEFPSLYFMFIDECPELKSFIFDEKEVSNDDLPPPLFDEKVELPTIESLTIWSVNLKRIWRNELAPGSFCKLDYLDLYNCENLLNVFPSNMLTRLQNLQELEIRDCESMDVIFDLEGPNSLEMHITKLESITIFDCPSLRYIFPLSIGIGLQELERLLIGKCAVIENIIATEGVVDEVIENIVATEGFEFPKFTSLILKDLPRLRSFYPGIHTSEWPLLTTLEVFECNELKIFASECSNVQEGMNDEQPLFLHEKEIFPNLEKLLVTWNYTMNEMWHGEFRFEVFCRLKSFEVHDFHDEIITSFPSGFFKKLPNLEELNVYDSDFEEIFPNGGVIGETGELSTFCSLKTLTLLGCGKLKILFPSSLLSFCNLITLAVVCCDGLTNLISSSTAKSMIQLQYLTVSSCEMMTSIVECVGEGEAEDDIIFPQLKTLSILSMPSLSSFCGSGKLAFRLPSLEIVIVLGCPNLKTFCEGPLLTFKLQSVEVSTSQSRWNGDLNTTIQTLYKERGSIIRSSDQDDDDAGDEDFSSEEGDGGSDDDEEIDDDDSGGEDDDDAGDEDLSSEEGDGGSDDDDEENDDDDEGGEDDDYAGDEDFDKS